jgi:ribosomal protein S18 acetylase RimI-like enzyme
MAGSLAVGQIRFDRIDDDEWISYSLDAITRGRGWGRRLVSLGLRALRETGPAIIRADVKTDNGASSAVFEGLGFTTVEPADPGYVSFLLDQRGGKRP